MASQTVPLHLNELLCVVLLKDFEVDGVRLAAGKVGTIVHAYTNANAYILEFAEPVGTLLDVERADIELYAA